MAPMKRWGRAVVGLRLPIPSRFLKGALACLSVTALILGSGCTEAPSWHGRDLDQVNPSWLNVTLAPSWSARWDVIGGANSEVVWDWFTQERQPIAFQVFRHQPEGLEPLRSVHSTDDEGKTGSPTSALHSLIWQNDSTVAVVLWIRADTPVGGGLYEPGRDPSRDECLALVAIC